MDGIIMMIVFLMLFAIVAVFHKVVSSGIGTTKVVLPYQKEPALFTPAERAFLGVFEQVLGNQFRVFGKVRLADVISVRPGLQGTIRQQAFNRIQSKHLDFVVCSIFDLSIQFVVELDDSSHQQPHRQARDEFLNKALAAAGVPIFRFSVKRAYSVHQIYATIFGQSPNQRA
jgi:very-short-patch-repair endonuclease